MKVGLLLAAGTSRRFGEADKLLAPYRGEPLIAHAARALTALPLEGWVAVTTSSRVTIALKAQNWPGDIVRREAGALMGETLTAGLTQALEMGASSILIALGDMPNVTPDHLGRVLRACPSGGASASRLGTVAMPPACFSAAVIAPPLPLTGDKGAGSLIKALPEECLVSGTSDILRDIDTQTDLVCAEKS